LPDGTVQPLLWIKDWDFNWQDRYTYKAPVHLPHGTRIDVKITYNNSADNPRNPSNPPREVWWGEQSTDEMGSISFAVTADNKLDQLELVQALRSRFRTAVARAVLDGTVTRLRKEQLESEESVTGRKSPLQP